MARDKNQGFVNFTSYLQDYDNNYDSGKDLLMNDYNYNDKKNNNVSKYVKNGKIVTYNHRTMEFYRVARLRKMDPIIYQDLDDRSAFVFADEWDPYTGERLGKDPYGPFYFNPDNLIRYFY